MPQSIKLIASIVATAIAVVAYIPYLVDMFRGKNKPHVYTWISIFLVTFVVAVIQFIGGGGLGAIPTALGAFINGIILFYCFRFGTKDVVFLDKICLGLSIAGVATFVVFYSRPLLSLAIVTAAEIISFLPTFRKTHNDPYSESLTSYHLIMLKLTLILVALKNYNVLTVSYSAVWGAVLIVFLSRGYRWRRQIKRPPHDHPDVPGAVVI